MPIKDPIERKEYFKQYNEKKEGTTLCKDCHVKEHKFLSINTKKEEAVVVEVQ